MPSFNSPKVRFFGVRAPNNARWISSELNRPARRTTILLPSSSHSKTEPGPMPSFRRTSTGTEICPWAYPKPPTPPPAILGASPNVVDHSGLFQLSRGRFLRLLARRTIPSWCARRGPLCQLLLLRPLGSRLPRHHPRRVH